MNCDPVTETKPELDVYRLSSRPPHAWICYYNRYQYSLSTGPPPFSVMFPAYTNFESPSNSSVRALRNEKPCTRQGQEERRPGREAAFTKAEEVTPKEPSQFRAHDGPLLSR